VLKCSITENNCSWISIWDQASFGQYISNLKAGH